MSGGRAGAPAGSVLTGKGRDEGPRPVGGLVGALLERLGIAEKVSRARAAAEWEETVGPHIARVTRNPVVRGRTLFVDVASAAWLAELNMQRHELLKRINAGRSGGRIEKIVFLQSDGVEPRVLRGPDRRRRWHRTGRVDGEDEAGRGGEGDAEARGRRGRRSGR